jgi:predicted dehydrogenase
MYLDAICGTYRAAGELVAMCDSSAVRLDYHRRRIAEQHGVGPVATYRADEFTTMIAERRPDVVIVTTVDAIHHRYIVEALESGCDVITEKPMTIDAEKVALILDAVARTGRHVTVTFNYRYSPAFTRLHQLVAGGAIGTPLLVDFSWMLDTSHGADYFRRWHREKANSGGLLVHKASHHFDLVNWWVGSWPKTVFALGSLGFYGDVAAAARGEHYDYDRYTGGADGDPFALDLRRSPMLRGLYLEAEAETGYRRDQNVFAPGITIEDTMAVSARYANGVLLSYSLVAYSPWEGVRVAITGDKGRAELYERHRAHVIEETPTGAAPVGDGDAVREIVLFPMFKGPTAVDIPRDAGSHGGDSIMLERIFSADPRPDVDGWSASHLDGAASVLLGVAANRSIGSGLAVQIDDLVNLNRSISS